MLESKRGQTVLTSPCGKKEGRMEIEKQTTTYIIKIYLCRGKRKGDHPCVHYLSPEPQKGGGEDESSCPSYLLPKREKEGGALLPLSET